MAYAVKTQRVIMALFAVATTALLIYFGTGLSPFWPLLWFAPLPVLLYAARSSWRAAALTATLAWAAGNLNVWHYYTAALQVPLIGRLEIIIVPALVFALAVALYRALLCRGAGWSALVAVPATWVSFEYLFNLTSPHGTAISLSYSQLNFLPMLQLASITGPWGISFLVLAFSAALGVAVHLWPTSPRQAVRIAGATTGAIALVLVFGAVRLALPPPAHHDVKVGLIASDFRANAGVAAAGAATERLLHDYAEQAETLAEQGAQVIVLPEHLGEVVDRRTANADAIFQPLADKTGSTIVVGVSHVSPHSMANQARIYQPNAAVESYDKHHLLPPFESRFAPGQTLTLLTEPDGKWGVAICKDMDFTQLSRQYGQAGAGLMLAPAWDFVLDRILHGHMAIMRGVESGFSIARAARGGSLTVNDNRGRIIAEVKSNSAPFATLLASVPAVHDNTLYLRLGDWFAWLVLLLLAMALLRLILLTRSRPR